MGDDDNGDELLLAARIPKLVITSAILLALAAAFVGLVALQNLAFVTWRGSFALMPYGLLVLAVAGLFVASKLHRARGWSLGAGLAVGALLVLSSGGFFVLSILSGMLSPLALLAVPTALAALVVEVLAARPFSELTARRTRLKKAGFDLDL